MPKKHEDENEIERAQQGALYSNLERIYNFRLSSIVAIVLCSLMLSACASSYSKTNFAIISNYDHKKVMDCGKKKIVLIGGCFDLLHYGHVRFFEKAKALGDHLTVGVSPDSRAALMKRPPIFSCIERAEVVRAIKYVDSVMVDGPRIISLDFMRKNNFELYIFGALNLKEREIRLGECLDLPTSMVIELPYSQEVSSTKILKNLT